MGFAGLKKDDERADLIAYLRTLADNPAPLPEAGAAASRRRKAQPSARRRRRAGCPGRSRLRAATRLPPRVRRRRADRRRPQ